MRKKGKTKTVEALCCRTAIDVKGKLLSGKHNQKSCTLDYLQAIIQWGVKVQRIDFLASKCVTVLKS